MLEDCIWRQGDFVHESFGVDQRVLFERGQTTCEGIDKRFDLFIWQRPVDVAVALGEISRKVVGAEDHLQPATAAHQAGKSRHRVSAGYRAHADFKLPEDSSLAAGETHIAREDK